MTRIFFKSFWKINTSQELLPVSGELNTEWYQGDNIVIWREKIKDGRHDQNILFWKIDAA